MVPLGEAAVTIPFRHLIIGFESWKRGGVTEGGSL